MADNCLKVTHEELTNMIREQVEIVLREYADKASDYYRKLNGIVPAVMDNLLCIAIYHNTIPQTIPHWANRAKQLPLRCFVKKTKSSINRCIKDIFDFTLGEDNNGWNENAFKIIINYYKRKDKQMLADKSAIECYRDYSAIVSNTMRILEKALTQSDIDMWEDAVDNFVNEIKTF